MTDLYADIYWLMMENNEIEEELEKSGIDRQELGSKLIKNIQNMTSILENVASASQINQLRVMESWGTLFERYSLSVNRVMRSYSAEDPSINVAYAYSNAAETLAQKVIENSKTFDALVMHKQTAVNIANCNPYLYPMNVEGVREPVGDISII